MFLLPSKWQRLAWTITWYLGKTVKQPKTSLQYGAQIALKCLVFGKHWTNRFLMVSQHSGTTSDDINQTKNFIQFCRVVNQIEDCKLGLFQDASFAGDLRDLKIQRQEVYCACLDPTRLFQLRGCARSKPQFLTAVQSLNFSPGAGLRVDGSPALQFGECLGKTSSKPARETLSVTYAKESFRFTHILTTFFNESIDHVPPNIPNSSDSTRLYVFEDTAAVIQMIKKGRSPNLKHVTRTHRVDLDRFVWESEPGSFYFWSKYVRVTDQLADLLTKGIFTTLRCAVAFIVDIVATQTTVWIKWCPQLLLANLFSCRTLAKLQAMSQVMTQHENVDQKWSENASKVSKSGCALDGHLALEQLRNCEFLCTQDKRDLLAGCTISRRRRDTSCKLWYCISDLEKTKGLWDTQSFRRRIVEDARGRSSCLLRCCFM